MCPGAARPPVGPHHHVLVQVVVVGHGGVAARRRPDAGDQKTVAVGQPIHPGRRGRGQPERRGQNDHKRCDDPPLLFVHYPLLSVGALHLLLVRRTWRGTYFPRLFHDQWLRTTTGKYCEYA